MRNNIKLFVGILIGIVISGIGAYAINTINASDITYTKNGTDTNVESALNDLYTTQNTTVTDLESQLSQYENKFRTFIIYLRAADQGRMVRTQAGFHAYSSTIRENYKYFKVMSTTGNEYAEECYVTGWSYKQSKAIDLVVGQQYEYYSSTDEYQFSNFYAYAKSNTSGQIATCGVRIDFYN